MKKGVSSATVGGCSSVLLGPQASELSSQADAPVLIHQLPSVTGESGPFPRGDAGAIASKSPQAERGGCVQWFGLVCTERVRVEGGGCTQQHLLPNPTEQGSVGV